MENKTAVEWLLFEIKGTKWKNANWEKRKLIIEQAKEMEKSQIIESADVCCGTIKLAGDKKSYTRLSGEQFYNMKYIQKII